MSMDMRRGLSYDLVRIRTLRSTWVLTGSCLALTIVTAVGLTISPVSTTPAGLGDQSAYASALVGAVPFTPLLMGLLGVFTFGHEYRYGTLRTALCALPRRSTLAAAKVLAVAVWAAGVVAVGVVASALVLALLGSGRFEPGVGVTADDMIRVAVGIVVYVVLFALMGVALGWLFRSVPVAITLLVSVPFVVEPFLRVLLAAPGLSRFSAVPDYLPFGAGSRLYSYDSVTQSGMPATLASQLSPAAGGLVMTAAVAVLLGAAYTLFRRGDA